MAAEASTHPVEITDGTFDEFVKTHETVVVDCWAPWCGPCKRIAPILEELASEYGGRVAFGKLNTDDNPSTPTKYGIMSIPTLLIFKNGQRVDQIVGLMPKEQLKSRIDKHVG